MIDYEIIASTRNDERTMTDPEGWAEYVIIQMDSEEPVTKEQLNEIIFEDFNSHTGVEGCPGQWFRRSYSHMARLLEDNKALIVVEHAMDI